MKEIDLIYHNRFGVAFRWKPVAINGPGKVQLVFRDMGMLLTRRELQYFSECIRRAEKDRHSCNHCTQQETCRTLLVSTPAPQVTLALNVKELGAIGNLVNGCLFQLELEDLINDI